LYGYGTGKSGVTAKPIWVPSTTAGTEGGRQGKDMVADSKYINQVNIREGAEVFKLKDDVGTRTDEYKEAKNTFRQETTNFLTVWRMSSGIPSQTD